MAISVDTVYQKVLVIANKEQRGYITPQEFNLFANQAQLDIFEQYFYDINQFGRLHGNDTEYSDMLNTLDEKLGVFKTSRTMNHIPAQQNYYRMPDNLYKLGTVIFTRSGKEVEVEPVLPNEVLYMNLSPLAAPTLDRPVYCIREGVNAFRGRPVIEVWPNNLTWNISANYIRRPAFVQWGYIVLNEQALYNADASIQFDLHESEETDLVIKILALAGIMMKDPNIYQIAAQEDMKDIQQEKQ
jgi:hypothetical protein